MQRTVATPCSILTWEMLWTEKAGGLQSLGSKRVRHNLATKKQQQEQTSSVPRELRFSTKSVKLKQELNITKLNPVTPF